MEIGTVITTTVKNAKASECLKCGLCEKLHKLLKKSNNQKEQS